MPRIILLIIYVIFISACAISGKVPTNTPELTDDITASTTVPGPSMEISATMTPEESPTTSPVDEALPESIASQTSAHAWVQAAEAVPESAQSSFLLGEVSPDDCPSPATSWNSAENDPSTLLILSFYQEITPSELVLFFAGELAAVDHVELLNQNTGYSVTLQPSDAILADQGCRTSASLPVVAEAPVTQALVFINGTGGEILLDGVEMIGANPQGDSVPVYWRMGGSRGASDATLQEPVALAVNPFGQVYVGDAITGIVVYDWEGNFVQSFNPDIRGRMVDLDLTGQGNLVITDRDQAEIVVLDPGGMEMLRFGSRGSGDSQFGDEGPLATVVFPQEQFGYILDRGPVATGESQYRIQTFDFSTGEWIQTLPVPSDLQTETITTMSIDSYGFLYFTAEGLDSLFRFEPGYDTASRYAEESLKGVFPAALTFNAQDELYLAAHPQSDRSVIHLLDALGYEYRQFGQFISKQSNQDWNEGSFVQPTAIQADPYGQFLFITDYSDHFAYLTCYQLFSLDDPGS